MKTENDIRKENKNISELINKLFRKIKQSKKNWIRFKVFVYFL